MGKGMRLVKMAENSGSVRELSGLKRPWDADSKQDGSKLLPIEATDNIPDASTNKRSKDGTEMASGTRERFKLPNPSRQRPTTAALGSEASTPLINGEPSAGDVQPSTSSHVEPTVADHADEDEEDNVSEISGLSDISIEGEGWRPMAGPMSWVQRQMQMGADPREILKQLIPHDAVIPQGFDDLTLWKIIINVITEPPKRKKLPDVNTLDDVVKLMRKSKKIMVLTGAGVSVSCGIPDFRSRDGIYARLHVEYPDLPDPQAMFDIDYFKKNPNPFFKFAKEIYPGQFAPSLSHMFIKLIEDHGKLLRNYTQNIDTLEQVAGISNVVQCHGSFATATCMICKHKVDAEVVREDIMAQVIPRCPHCLSNEPLAIMKPDIVFFGESLPTEFHTQMEADKDECDLLIVIGSSLKVRPVALIPNSLPSHVPQILINRESLKHLNFDVELLGDGDVIVSELCHRIGDTWSSLKKSSASVEVTRDELSTPPVLSPHRLSPTGNSDASFQNTTEEKNGKSTCEGKVKNSSSLAEPHESSSKEGATSQLSANSVVMNSQTSDVSSSSSTGDKSSAEKVGPDAPAGTDDLPGSGESAPAKAKESTSYEVLRSYCKPRVVNLAARLKEGTYLRLPPNRYVFRGAEVYSNGDDSEDEPLESSSSSCSDLDSEGMEITTQSTDADGQSSPAHSRDCGDRAAESQDHSRDREQDCKEQEKGRPEDAQEGTTHVLHKPDKPNRPLDSSTSPANPSLQEPASAHHTSAPALQM